MAKSIMNYAGGINQLGQAAVREDGTLFVRTQYRTGYGYSWTKWTKRGLVDTNNLPASIPHGFGNMYRASKYDCMSKVRLPNS